MRRINLLLLMVISLLVCGFTLSAQEQNADKDLDIIRFGLENEIVQLLNSLTSAKKSDYTSELLTLFSSTRSPLVRENMLALFSVLENNQLSDFALEVLDDPDEYRGATVQATLEYVSAIKLKEAAPAVRRIIERETSVHRPSAIQTIGKIGSEEDALFLLEYFNGEIPGDDKLRLVTRQSIMAALADLHLVEIWPQLSEIVSDSEENVMIRASAAESISQMGKVEAVPLLLSLYEETDPILRTAAMKGIGYFSTAEAEALILEGFRDSYYKVRQEAIMAAEQRQLAAAWPYVLYRAKNDPVEAIQFRAYETLVKSGYNEGITWLKSKISDSQALDRVRFQAANAFIRFNYDAARQEVSELVIACLKDDKKTWLRYELGKILAREGPAGTSDLAEGYLSHADVLTKSLGLDMYEKHRYVSLTGMVEAIAANDRMGALQRRAKRILGQQVQ